MKVPLREYTYGPCPYLKDAPYWRVAEFSIRQFSADAYERLLAQGFRRSGTSFYRTICEGCDRCIPLRVDALRFRPTNSQRRVMRRNDGTEVFLYLHGTEFREDRFRLYEDYCRDRHGRVDGGEDAPLAYKAFLVDSPLGDLAVTEYRVPGCGTKLAANGYLDVLPQGLSSVYFAWDKEYRKLSLGTYSIIREIELCRKMGKRWYYLGFWVPGSPAMDYKANFSPAEIAFEGSWIPLVDGMRQALRGAA